MKVASLIALEKGAQRPIFGEMGRKDMEADQGGLKI